MTSFPEVPYQGRTLRTVDPLGMPLESFRAIAWELDEWISKLVDGLFGRPVASTDIFGERKAAP